MNKTIWMFNHYAHPPNIAGGTRHYDFAKELIKQGYNVTIFASSFLHRAYYDVIKDNKNYKIENFEGVKFVWLKTPSYFKNDFNRIKNMLMFAWRSYYLSGEFDNPDTIIGSTPDLFTALSAKLLSNKFKADFLLEVRDLWPQTFVDTGKFRKYNLVIQGLYLLEKFLYKSADSIITLLPGSEEYITKKGINKDKIINIPNGVDVDRFIKLKNEKSQSKLVSKIIKETNSFRLLYAGAHGPAQDLGNILRAAKIIQDNGYEDISFILIGDGPSKQNLKKLSKKLELENVNFYESIPKYEIPHLMDKIDVNIFNLKKADVFKYGVSANKIFDYLCSAKPMIFSCDTKEPIVNKSHSGIVVPPENPKELSNAIKKLYNMEKSNRKELGFNGLEYVKKYHDIDYLVNKLISIIE